MRERGALVDALARRYGAPDARLVPIYERDKAMYVVHRRDGPQWVLHLYPARRPIERLRGQAAILLHVERHGVSAERLVPTLDGAPFTTLGDRGVLVTTFIAGKFPSRTPVVLYALGESVGRLHALAAASSDDPSLTRRAGAMPREDLALGRACLERISDRVPQAHRVAYDALHAALQSTRDCEDLLLEAYGLLHNDCHLANAIETADGGVAWIDWDGAGHGPRIAALGLLLYSCAIQAPDEKREPCLPTEPSLIAQRVEAVLEGYRRHHLLTSEELNYLPDAVRFRPAVIAARELANAIERGEPLNTTGWWARYAEADLVAECARRAFAG